MTIAAVEKKVAIWLKTLSGPRKKSSAPTGISQMASQGSAALKVLPSSRLASVGADRRRPGVPRDIHQPIRPAPSTTKGKGAARKNNSDEGGEGEGALPIALERARGDPLERVEDDREHRRLQPEQHARDRADIAGEDVEPAQPHDRDDAGEDEQQSGDEPAAHAVEQPADVGRELLRLGAGKQRAEVERVEETLLVDPAFFVDQHAVHQRDLRRRAAERQQGDPRPGAGGVGEAGRGVSHQSRPKATATRSGSANARR